MTLLTIPQAAAKLAVSESTVRRHIPIVRIGGCLRVDEEALQDYIRERQTGKPPTEKEEPCESSKRSGTRTASTGGRTARIGGQAGWTTTEKELAALLGLKR